MKEENGPVQRLSAKHTTMPPQSTSRTPIFKTCYDFSTERIHSILEATLEKIKKWHNTPLRLIQNLPVCKTSTPWELPVEMQWIVMWLCTSMPVNLYKWQEYFSTVWWRSSTSCTSATSVSMEIRQIGSQKWDCSRNLSLQGRHPHKLMPS